MYDDDYKRSKALNERITNLARETNQTKKAITEQLLEFALDRAGIETIVKKHKVLTFATKEGVKEFGSTTEDA